MKKLRAHGGDAPTWQVDRIPFVIHGRFCLSSACEGTELGGAVTGGSWAGAEGTRSGPAIVFMSYKTLSGSHPHPSQASAMSSVKCQGWQICGTPGFPYTAVPLAGIANQLLPSFPAAFFSDLGFFPGLWAGSGNL